MHTGTHVYTHEHAYTHTLTPQRHLPHTGSFVVYADDVSTFQQQEVELVLPLYTHIHIHTHRVRIWLNYGHKPVNKNKT